jgi:tetratricopeptide (TPR) repeat protein
MPGLRNGLTAAAMAVALCVDGSAVLGSPPAPRTGPAPQEAQAPNVFQKFATASSERAFIVPIIQLFREGRYADAEAMLRRLAEKFPQSALYHYNLAAALARQAKADAALDSLAAAVRFGFTDTSIAERDADFDAVRGHVRYKALIAAMSAAARDRKPSAVRIAPARIVQGRAVVDEANTSWEPRNNLLLSLFAFEPRPPNGTARGGEGAAAERLNEWFAKGEAAGNHGDLYDNRDRGHSRLSASLLPQVAHIEYGQAARDAGVDYGVNPGILFNAVTFGNSSTALTSSFAWRSQARLVLTDANLVARAYLQYANNHLYVYPEHRDHDRGQGDLIPANTPYMVISQGSSGSDKPFLNAVGAILAAFRPEVKALLRDRKLVMPTVQMVLRRGQKSVRTDAAYRSGQAHPTVFSAEEIDLSRMIALANGLRADGIPPMVTLAVAEEDKANPGADYFAPATVGEALFDTPSAIARLVRSTRYEKRIVVTAGATKDPNGRPLAFHWTVLRGDADRIAIKPLDDKRQKVEIRIPWHERRTVPSSPELTTDRVDIGVFADNGKALSAPAFITYFYPGDQKRSYEPEGRVRCIDYDDPGFRKRYVDPLLFPARKWRDCYDYDDSGALLGWNRVGEGSLQRFTRHGHKVVETDSEGRPAVAEGVRYEIEPAKSGRPNVVQVSTGERFIYRYRDAEDRLGTPSAQERR